MWTTARWNTTHLSRYSTLDSLCHDMRMCSLTDIWLCSSNKLIYLRILKNNPLFTTPATIRTVTKSSGTNAGWHGPRQQLAARNRWKCNRKSTTRPWKVKNGVLAFGRCLNHARCLNKMFTCFYLMLNFVYIFLSHIKFSCLPVSISC